MSIDIAAIRKLAASVAEHDTRAMPNGTERPGEHWNARLIREAAERQVLARALVPALCDEIERLRAEREHMELNPAGIVEWLKNRVNELTAELAKARAEGGAS